jgi:hypothetical protein
MLQPPNFRRCPRKPRLRRSAWTLTELLVAFAILGILLALGLTALNRAREQANALQCRTNLKNLALAVHAHHTIKGTMPPYASGMRQEIIGSWFTHLLPYVGHQDVYDRLANGQRVSMQGVRMVADGRYLPGVHGVMFPELICPSDPTRILTDDAPTNYLANWYAFTNANKDAYHPPERFIDLHDGLSNVVLFAEAYSQAGRVSRLALYSAGYHNFGITQKGLPSDDHSYAPEDYSMFQVRPVHADKWRTQTPHSEMPVALADGSVRAVNPNISLTTWKHALKPRDGHELGEDW